VKKTYNRYHEGLLFSYLGLAALLVLPIAFGSGAWGKAPGHLLTMPPAFNGSTIAPVGAAPGEIIIALGSSLDPRNQPVSN
jgi:hypothetical protein